MQYTKSVTVTAQTNAEMLDANILYVQHSSFLSLLQVFVYQVSQESHQKYKGNNKKKGKK